jgi:transposase-like protein
MSKSRRNFSKQFKEAAVRRLNLGASFAEVARGCEVDPNVLHRWRRELSEHGAKAFSGNGKARLAESQVADLERKGGPPGDGDRFCETRPVRLSTCDSANGKMYIVVAASQSSASTG